MERDTSNHVALTIIVSVTLTLVILAAGVYVFRAELASYVVNSIDDQLATPHTQDVIVQMSEDRVVETIAAANPAVISIVVTKDVPIYERYLEEYNPFGGWFGGFSVPRIRENGTEEREVGGGSGFIVTADGLAVTNRHVVADAEARYSAVTATGEIYNVLVVALDPVLDVAVVQLEPEEDVSFAHLDFGDSESLQLGQTVIAIGNALAEFNNSVSVGIVSGLGRSVVAGDGRGMSEQLEEVIQTDAAINPGNSGGPLLDLNGEVIGVNVAASLGADNIGFALPAHVVRGVVESVEEFGEIRRPYLGVRYAMVTPGMVERNNLAVDYGALVIRGETLEDLAVIPGSPAARAGIQEGDIILSIGGTQLRDRSLAQVIRSQPVDEAVTLELWRNGETRTVAVTLEQSATGE